jgi:O-antigen/teichoic acid export membrane protein
MTRSSIRNLYARLSKSPLYETMGHSRNYLISSVAQQGLSFISIPVFTHLLTPEDYGILNIFAAFVDIFTILLVLNLNGAISRYYFEEREDFGSFLGFSVSLAAGLFALSAAGILLFQQQVSAWLNLPLSVIPYFIPSTLLYIISYTFKQIYLPRRDSIRIRRYDVGQTYLGFAFAVGFILLQQNELYLGRLKSDVAILLIFGFLRMRDVWKFISFKIDIKHLKYILNFCLPNIPYLLSGIIISQIDRFMINKIDGARDAGLYSFAYNIATIQLLVSNALHYAWTPKYYEYMNRKNYQQIDKESHFLIKVMTLSAIFLVLFAKEIGALLSSKSYHAALYLIPIILVGHFFVGLMPFNKNAIQHAKKTYITAGSTLSGGVLSILLNAFFIPRYGYVAAAFTSVASYLFVYCAEFVISKYVLKYHVFPVKQMTLELMVLAMIVMIYYFFFAQQIGFTFKVFVYKILIILVVPIVIFWKERHFLLAFMRG